MDTMDARERRKHAYRQAKKIRDADPAYIALKEKAKLERKERYHATKKALKDEKILERKLRQAEKDAVLLAMVMPGIEFEKKQQAIMENNNEEILSE